MYMGSDDAGSDGQATRPIELVKKRSKGTQDRSIKTITGKPLVLEGEPAASEGEPEDHRRVDPWVEGTTEYGALPMDDMRARQLDSWHSAAGEESARQSVAALFSHESVSGRRQEIAQLACELASSVGTAAAFHVVPEDLSIAEEPPPALRAAIQRDAEAGRPLSLTRIAAHPLGSEVSGDQVVTQPVMVGKRTVAYICVSGVRQDRWAMRRLEQVAEAAGAALTKL
jgi:hypothetical protein